MRLHRNAKLGLAGRFALVQAREQGLSMREVASRLQRVAGDGLPLVGRWRRGQRGGALDVRLPARPLEQAAGTSPRLLPAGAQRQICAARAPHRLGPAAPRPCAPAIRTRPISKVLKRNGLSRPPRVAREPARRYEWPCPGDLLHMDVTHYARFTRPGHAVTGDRSSTGGREAGEGRLRATRTRSSTTTRASPTPSSWTTSAPRP